MKQTQWLVALAALMAMFVQGAAPASADGLIYELKGGALYHDAPLLWSHFQLEKTSVDVNVEAQLSPSMQAFLGTIRPAIGGSINTQGQTSHAYSDLRWTFEAPSGLFLGLGLGAAIHDGALKPIYADRKALGGRVLFHVPLELGYYFDRHNSISAYFEHTSNAYTNRYNEALDRIGVRYGYRF